MLNASEAAVLGPPRNRMAELITAVAVEPESIHGVIDNIILKGARISRR